MRKTPKEIAEEYGFSVSQIRKLICKGLIKAEKFGRFYVINSNDVKKLKRRRKPSTFQKDERNAVNE